MATKPKGRRHKKSEFSRLGKALFETHIRPRLKATDKGKYVAIDIETGEFEMHRDDEIATNRLWERLGDPQPFLMRVGHPAAIKLGRSL